MNMNFKIAVLLVCCFSVTFIHAQFKNTVTVEGILFSDGSPVSISIEDSEISEITRLDESIKEPPYYDAPGFIDL